MILLLYLFSNNLPETQALELLYPCYTPMPPPNLGHRSLYYLGAYDAFLNDFITNVRAVYLL